MPTSDKTEPINYDKSTDEGAKGAAQQAHAEVFSNPDQFMSTLRENFSKLSRGHDDITLNDLKLDGADQSLDPKLRAAAQISATHFDELLSIGAQQAGGQNKGTTLSKDDVFFGSRMVEDLEFLDATGAAEPNFTESFASGTVGTIAAFGTIGAALTASEGGALAAVALAGGAAVGAGVVAVAGLGYAGYELYKGISTYGRYLDEARADQANISKWINS